MRDRLRAALEVWNRTHPSAPIANVAAFRRHLLEWALGSLERTGTTLAIQRDEVLDGVGVRRIRRQFNGDWRR